MALPMTVFAVEGLVNNPFEYGATVSGAAFCNRAEESGYLLRIVDNSLRTFVYSERMMGKTSLVLRVLESLDREKYVAAYIDLWASDDEASFITATAKGISLAMSSDVSRVLELAKKFFARLAPTISLDDEGRPKLGFEYNPTAEQARKGLEEVLAVPQRIAKETGKKVVIVFDEMQRILEYGDDHVERLLRSIIQMQKNVAYIFLGSQKHLLQEMFLNRKRPLYSAANHFPVGPIDVAHWLPFIRAKFETTGKKIDDPVIRRICELTQGHPFYTQYLCHTVWERLAPGKKVTPGDVASGLQVLLDREAKAYSTLWETLTVNQRRFLRGLAFEERELLPYSIGFVTKYGLGSPSATQRISGSLLKRDVIDRDGRFFIISDRVFRLWIRKRKD
jgi:hypothetical protein